MKIPLLLSLLLVAPLGAWAAPASHPPLRVPVLSKALPKPTGPVHFVDPQRGDDAGAGSREKPWRSINAALPRLKPGDTLLLRGGTYYENVYCAVVGTPEQPITIRSYPGETAVLDGGLPEFQQSPATAWEPGEAEGEYVSARTYPNIRDVVGLFGDSNVGLQTYWHHAYLVAQKEHRGVEGGGKDAPEPGFYCGPGLFYNKATGRIHARLAHTVFSPTQHQYRGEQDPRKLPLVIAPFRSTPLHIDQGMHLRFENLVIRGGGWNTVQLSFAVDVEFRYVTLFGGSYCIRAKNSGPVKWEHCGIYGGVPPWGFWTDNALHTYDGKYYDPYTQPPEPRAARNIARLPTHALLVTEGYEESDIFALPLNNRWEIAHCNFADGHDGIYLNGREMWLHHSRVTDIQDDAIYLSNPTPGTNEEIDISHNFIARCTAAFGAHLRGGPAGEVRIYQNVMDLRDPYQRRRPAHGVEEKAATGGMLYLPHGRGDVFGMENLFFGYNTVLLNTPYFAGNLSYRSEPRTQRAVVNNIFIYGKLPPLPLRVKPGGLVRFDGNLHWLTPSGDATGAEWLRQITESEASKANVAQWGGTLWEVHSQFADPQFVRYNPAKTEGNDLALRPESPARGAALEVETPLRTPAGKNVGAWQGEAFRFGVGGSEGIDAPGAP